MKIATLIFAGLLISTSATVARAHEASPPTFTLTYPDTKEVDPETGNQVPKKNTKIFEMKPGFIRYAPWGNPSQTLCVDLGFRAALTGDMAPLTFDFPSHSDAEAVRTAVSERGHYNLAASDEYIEYPLIGNSEIKLRDLWLIDRTTGEAVRAEDFIKHVPAPK
jgi:hypothetical protein